MKVDFSIINKTNQKIPRRYFLFVLKKFLKKTNIRNKISVSLVFVGERKIKDLNNKYRNKNHSTDVLSFPIDIVNSKEIKRGGEIILGDIFICPKFIKKNKQETFKNELGSAFLHGLIHLIGYNHDNEKDKKKWNNLLKTIDDQDPGIV